MIDLLECVSERENGCGTSPYLILTTECTEIWENFSQASMGKTAYCGMSQV